jgi:DnaK suppressor protein
MDATQIETLRTILESRLEELSAGIRDRDKFAIEKEPDMIDEAQLAEERDLAIRFQDRAFKEIRLTQMALARIEDSTYGSCLRCEEAIHWKRLRVAPHAALCVACQEKADRGGFSEFSLLKDLVGASKHQ